MTDLIDYYLIGRGFTKLEKNRYRHMKEGINVYLDTRKCMSHIKSEKMSITINCEFDQVFDIVGKILEDPWKYQKHLFRNFLDCIDYFDEHYDKELRDLGLERNPCIQRADNRNNDIRFETQLELKYEFSYYNYIWFPYHPGIESIITYLDYDGVNYIDMLKIKDEDIIKKIFMYYPEITHRVEGTKERYLEFEKYRKTLQEGYDEKIVKIEDFTKKYPKEWIGIIKGIGRNIKIV